MNDEVTCHANAEVRELRGGLDVSNKINAMLETRVCRFPVFLAPRWICTQK